jgi:hypothetical protein
MTYVIAEPCRPASVRGPGCVPGPRSAPGCRPDVLAIGEPAGGVHTTPSPTTNSSPPNWAASTATGVGSRLGRHAVELRPAVVRLSQLVSAQLSLVLVAFPLTRCRVEHVDAAPGPVSEPHLGTGSGLGNVVRVVPSRKTCCWRLLDAVPAAAWCPGAELRVSAAVDDVGAGEVALLLPKTSSAQVRRHARTRGGCRRGGRVVGCRDGRSCLTQ